jgi:hypothetical protein
MKVRVVYDREGNILSADVAVEGSSVGEFDLPDENVSALDQATESMRPDSEFDHFRELLEGDKEDADDSYRSWLESRIRDLATERRSARQLSTLNLMRVDTDSLRLRPIEEAGSA